MDVYEKVVAHSIENITDFNGKLVLLRIDVNISLGENNQVDPGEDWRILKSLSSIHYLQERGAKVVLLSHIGRDLQETLIPVFEYMKSHVNNIFFGESFAADDIEQYLSNLSNGEVLFMENLRQHEAEKKNDIGFLAPLVARADCYINDAFSVSHRKHASVHAVTKELPSFFGFQFLDEIYHLSSFFEKTDAAKILVLGGAKFGTKLPLLEKMISQVDYVLMGGALANVFLKERGYAIGDSFCDDVDISHMVDNQKIIVPIDYVDQHGDVADIYDVNDGDIILDIGPATNALFAEIIRHGSMLMWNGPMGKYEDGYTEGSIHLAEEVSKNDIYAITGGGDTSTVVLEHDLEEDFDFISTGGGAMLDFLVDGGLPAIDVILEKAS